MGIPVQYTVGPWVKAANRLPEREGVYLVVLSAGGMREMVLESWCEIGGKGMWISKNSDFITHWMDLPPLAEESQ
jgi:hypothetical protein